jgi:hypothetical protein
MKLIGTLAALAVSSVAFAQTQPENPGAESSGVLGTRYVDYGFGYYDVNHSGTDAFGAGLTVNVPVAPSIDVALNYSYYWVEAHSDVDAHDLSLDGIYYIGNGPLKPFGGLTIGYNWNDWDNESFWGAFGGIEYQATSNIVLTGTASYTADFDDADEGYFDGTVTARYFFTRTIAAFVSTSWIEGGDLGFAGGVTLKF